MNVNCLTGTVLNAFVNSCNSHQQPYELDVIIPDFADKETKTQRLICPS